MAKKWEIKCPRCGRWHWRQVWVRHRTKKVEGFFSRVMVMLQSARGCAWVCNNCGYWDGDISPRKEM